MRAQTRLPVCIAGDRSAGETRRKPLLLGSSLERDARQQLSLEVKSVKGDCKSCVQACKGQREIVTEDFSPPCRKTNKKILVQKNHTHKPDTN